MIKKLKAYWNGKSVKQRIYICIALTALLTLLFFTVKVNFIDKPTPPSDTETAEAAEYQPPEFHISLIDAGILLGVIGAYSVHKIREKKKQGRL